jgi:hypothetical protein
MTWSGCEESTWWLTWALKQDVTSMRVAASLEAHEPIAIVIDHLVAELDDRVALTVRQELEALPSATVLSIVEAWRLASLGSKPFELTSSRPASPLDAARRRSVRLVVDVAEDGVRAEISHVASRHPTWQLNAIEAGSPQASPSA